MVAGGRREVRVRFGFNPIQWLKWFLHESQTMEDEKAKIYWKIDRNSINRVASSHATESIS